MSWIISSCKWEIISSFLDDQNSSWDVKTRVNSLFSNIDTDYGVVSQLEGRCGSIWIKARRFFNWNSTTLLLPTALRRSRRWEIREIPTDNDKKNWTTLLKPNEVEHSEKCERQVEFVDGDLIGLESERKTRLEKYRGEFMAEEETENLNKFRILSHSTFPPFSHPFSSPSTGRKH